MAMLRGAQLADRRGERAHTVMAANRSSLMVHNDQAHLGRIQQRDRQDGVTTKRYGRCSARSAAIPRISRCASASRRKCPIVNSAATDPDYSGDHRSLVLSPRFKTIVVQSYTLARRIYSGSQAWTRVALLRANDRYGRFGVLKFRDASRRLGHPL
jgi:hypothetical protein